ncbi:hypothetical protein OI71_19925 [Aeromonas hydrophila]|nr:hypothetical protein OI71_19925 [Aeromonas hydrophila]
MVFFIKLFKLVPSLLAQINQIVTVEVEQIDSVLRLICINWRKPMCRHDTSIREIGKKTCRVWLITMDEAVHLDRTLLARSMTTKYILCDQIW